MTILEQLKNIINTFDRNLVETCCDKFEHQLKNKCEVHGYDCPDKLLGIGISGNINNPISGWFGYSPNSTYSISHCPFCGKELPDLKNVLTSLD